MNDHQTAAAESLPQPLRVIDDAADYMPAGAVLAADPHGDAYVIDASGEITNGAPTYYRWANATALAAAASISRHAHSEHLGDICHGVAITRPDAPGWIAILATNPDSPVGRWGIYAGSDELAFDGNGWEDIPADWGTNPATIGATFARAYGRAVR